jgi:hypothetical protein
MARQRRGDTQVGGQECPPHMFAGGTTALLYQFGEGSAEVVGFEAEGAGRAFEDDTVVGIDEVKSVGPSGVGAFGGVAELVEHSGELDAELANAGAGDDGALFFVLRAGEDHVVFDVALHLPDVAGVGFEDVDRQERDLAVIVVVEFVESGNLPPEGRSSVAAEDEDNWLLGGERGELDGLALIELEEREVGRGVAGAEFPSASVGPEGFEGQAQEHDGGGHARHDAAEGFRGLVHGPDNVAGEGGVEHEHDDKTAHDPLLCSRTDPHWAEIVQDWCGGRL